jgi:hypothetical protein
MFRRESIFGARRRQGDAGACGTQKTALSERPLQRGAAKVLNTLSHIRLIEKPMKTKTLFSLLAAASLALNATAFAAGAKTYQVTGPVLEVTDAMIAVQKGKDRWEINRDANTKVTGDLKVGEKVTVTYTMSATDVEVKAGKGAKKEATSPAASPKQ